MDLGERGKGIRAVSEAEGFDLALEGFMSWMAYEGICTWAGNMGC